jgi:hypothetical protein
MPLRGLALPRDRPRRDIIVRVMVEGRAYRSLSSYRRCADRIRETWSQLQVAREDRRRQAVRHGTAADHA